MTTDNKTLAVDVLAVMEGTIQGTEQALADLRGKRRIECIEALGDLKEARAGVADTIQALAELADLYDTDEGCRSTPQYVAARLALARVKGESV